jgi:hypothetical protein
MVTSAWIGCGLVMGVLLKKHWGLAGLWLGFPLGVVGAFLFTWALLLGRILLFFPFPTCRQGKCRKISDYRWRPGTIYGYEGNGQYFYVCRCGTTYVRQGKRFMEALSDGSCLGYKRLVGFRQWDVDPTECGEPSVQSRKCR